MLVGDFLYSRAFQMMVDAGDMRVMEVLADATNVIAEGEVLQLMNMHDPALDEAGYLQRDPLQDREAVRGRARLGAVLAGSPPPLEQACADYGRHLGTAFQLIDDVLDYSGDAAEIGKNLGDDLREGKTTLPLISAMQRGTPGAARLVRHAIENGARRRARHDRGASCAQPARSTSRAQAAAAEAQRADRLRAAAARESAYRRFATIGGSLLQRRN